MSPASHERDLEPGTMVAGKLRVVRTLGVGGMGAVYEVEHALTRHHRALKILHRRVSQSAAVVARFQREASAAARIGNEHIAETFDAGTLDTGEAYLLMELLEGETLDARLKRLGPLDPRDLTDLVRQACDGVQAAHEAGIVHRDLKPENLFVMTRDNRPFVKVLDFGISKFDRESTGALGITAEGAVMGTPFYMPPEQVRGLTTIDQRADIYSLGVILYECACGIRPYMASTIEQLAILIHEGKAMPLSERRGTLPHGFCEVVMRAMAVDRDARFPTARALSDALSTVARISILPPGARNAASARVVLGVPVDGQTALGGTIPAMVPPTVRAAAVSALADTMGATPADAPSNTNADAPTSATASPVSDTMPPPASRPRRFGTPMAIVVAGAMVAVAVIGLRTRSGDGATATASPPEPARSAAPVVTAPPPSAPSSPLVPAPTMASASSVVLTDASTPPKLALPTRRLVGPNGVELSVVASGFPSALPPPPPRAGVSARTDVPVVPAPPVAPAASSQPTRAEKQGLDPDNPYAHP